MEADIGNPIDFNKELHDQGEEPDHQPSPQEYYPPMMMMPPPQQQTYDQKPDFFSNIDKTTWIVGFVVFLLGFFMGKTMQPVILRPG